MSLFSKVFKHHEDDFSKDFSSSDFGPPKESDPLKKSGSDQFMNSTDNNLLREHGEQNRSPDSPFNNDLFSSTTVSHTPSNNDMARGYAQQLEGGQNNTQQVSQSAGVITGHESQLILERLDTIKAELDAIKQRMMRIERFIENTETKSGRRYI